VSILDFNTTPLIFYALIMKNVRTVVLSFAVSVALLLTACGAGSVKDPFVPTRVVVFGDSLSVRTAGVRYTVNGSGGIDNWTDQIASSYGVTSFSANAVAEATVSGVAAQVSAFGGAYQSGDLVVMSAGFRDLIDLAQSASPTTAATALGATYGNAIRAAVSNGAKHVLAINMYDFSSTYSVQGGTASAANMKALIRAFNIELARSLVSPYVADNVRLVDVEGYMIAGKLTGFTDLTTVVCAQTDPSAGIGMGTGKLNSSLCTVGNVGAAYTSTYNNYLFADAVYLTPAGHRALGSFAYSAAASRW
jgi:outer membrane lipase/esterase